MSPGSGHNGQKRIVQWTHRPVDASSRGRIVQDALSRGCIVQEMHRPGDASSRGRFVQGTHRPGDASSRGHIVQGMHRPGDALSEGASSNGCIMQELSFRGHIARGQIGMASIFSLQWEITIALVFLKKLNGMDPVNSGEEKIRADSR